MNGRDDLHVDPLPWLLDPAEPGPRYLAMRDLLDLPPNDPALIEARRAAHTSSPIAEILAQMQPEGYWSEPGPGYNPKYYATVWDIIQLAQLGADINEDERIARACAYLLDHALAPGGQFTASGAPSGTADCLQGDLCWALAALGCADPRLDTAYEWIARTITGEGIAPLAEKHAPVRYYAGKRGPDFLCGTNNNQACAWGGVKVMLALSLLPPARRTPLITRAIARGLDFFFSVDPATAAYPNGWADHPSGNWWKFGFPVFYVTDLLQLAEALVAFCPTDPRLSNLLALIRQKQDAQGRWLLEYHYRGKTWVDYGPAKQPNKWVTLRALRVLKAAGG